MYRQNARLPKIDGQQIYMVENVLGQREFVTANSYSEAEQRAKDTFGWAYVRSYESIEVVVKK